MSVASWGAADDAGEFDAAVGGVRDGGAYAADA